MYPRTLKIVSACLAGEKCRYDCRAKTNHDIAKMVERGEAIALCPEQLGGLPTPRTPAEIRGDQVIDKDGKDVTANYQAGAQEALKIAQEAGATEAYLKSKSPMCGSGCIYDGTFSGELKKGDGVFAALLKRLGFKIHEVE